MPAIPDNDRRNFDILLRAAKKGDLALMDCWDTVEERSVLMVAAISQINGGSHTIIPLAVMVDSDVLNRYLPPGYDFDELGDSIT